jgi:hypothetical protein
MAYLIGQLGNWIPIPGGIGGVEAGLIGALILYGLPAVTATAAVLLYRVIELWIPGLLGIAAFVRLRVLTRRRGQTFDLCDPGEPTGIIGVSGVTVSEADFQRPGDSARVAPKPRPSALEPAPDRRPSGRLVSDHALDIAPRCRGASPLALRGPVAVNRIASARGPSS